MATSYTNKDVFTTQSDADLGMSDIYLNDAQYRHMILGHRDLRSVVIMGIQQTIENPTHVYLSKSAGGRFVFRSDHVQTKSGKAMAVVVERDQDRGKVITATPHMNTGGQLVWESSGSLYSIYDKDGDLFYVSKGAARDAYAVESDEECLWFRLADADNAPLGATVFDLRKRWSSRIPELSKLVADFLNVLPTEISLRVDAALELSIAGSGLA